MQYIYGTIIAQPLVLGKDLTQSVPYGEYNVVDLVGLNWLNQVGKPYVILGQPFIYDGEAAVLVYHTKGAFDGTNAGYPKQGSQLSSPETGVS